MYFIGVGDQHFFKLWSYKNVKKKLLGVMPSDKNVYTRLNLSVFIILVIQHYLYL